MFRCFRPDVTTAHEMFQEESGLDVDDDGYCELFDEWWSEREFDAACFHAESHRIEP